MKRHLIPLVLVTAFGCLTANTVAEKPRVIVTSEGEIDNGVPPLVDYQRVVCSIE